MFRQTTTLTARAQRLRNAARWSLWSAFALTLATGALLWLGLRDRFQVEPDPWGDVDFLEYRSVRDLRDLVRIDTTHETGREMDAALWVRDQLAGYGIDAEIEDMGGGKANLWAKIEGTTPEFLVLHGHLDTDPVGDRGSWRRDPWSGEIDVVWLYGRGSFDMKATVIAQVHALQAVQQEIRQTGRRPRRGLMLLLTSSEETGSHEGAQHIVANRPELLDGAWALFSEGGVVEGIDRHRIKYLGISFGQKRFIDVWYHADDRAALTALAEAIRERGHPDGRRLTEPVRRFLEHYASTRVDPAIANALADPDATIADETAWSELPDFYKSLFRDEVHVLGISPVAGDQSGTDGFRLRTVLHLLEDADEARLLRFLPAEEELSPGVTRHDDGSRGSVAASPLDHPAFEELVAWLRTDLADFEQLAVGPYYLTGYANDAQFFRKLNLPSYGFQPYLGIAADSYTVGAANERIALPTYVEGVVRFMAVVHALLD